MRFVYLKIIFIFDSLQDHLFQQLITMSYQIEFRHMRYFLAVAEHLHFRKASERLYISQPGLSKQIKELEDNLGIQLFERHNRKVKLTGTGAYLQSEFTRILKTIDHTLGHAKLLQEGKEGHLKFAYVGSAMQEIIPELLLRFRKQHPNVLFSLKEMDNQKQIDRLLSQDIDIGFARLERVPRGLEIKPLLEESFCLVLPKDHPVNEENFKELSQFKNESFIMFDSKHNPTYSERIMQIFDASGFTPLVSHNTIHSASIYKLVENNFGVSIVPKSLQINHNRNIKFIELENITQKTVLSAIWNTKNRNPSLEKLLSLIL